jgi:hypothetical protein
MGFSDAFVFRDCPWCGLRDAQMQTLIVNSPAEMADGVVRFWTLLSCPRCGSAVAIETNGPNEGPHQIRSVVPEDRITEQVSDLPTDVEQYYEDAARVLDAGVPGAAAVLLRPTLEGAAAHNGVTDGPLVARIQTLIKKGVLAVKWTDECPRTLLVT